MNAPNVLLTTVEAAMNDREVPFDLLDKLDLVGSELVLAIVG